MIRNVKSYFSQVGKRLTQVFNIQDFDQEAQTQFWTLAADLLSRDKNPAFRDIAQWIDLAYNAPAHFVYRKEGGQLRLFKRHIISDNLEFNNQKDKEGSNNSQGLRKFKQELDNLASKIEDDDSFQLINISSFSIGRCQHFPIFNKDQLWGIYCAGPYIEMPQCLRTHVSILSKILSCWLVKDYLKQDRMRYGATARLQKSINSSFGKSYRLEQNLYYLLTNLMKIAASDAGILVKQKDQFRILQSIHIPDQVLNSIKESAAGNNDFQLQAFYQQHTQLFKSNGFNIQKTIQIGKKKEGLFFYPLFKNLEDGITLPDKLLNPIGDTITDLLTYHSQQKNFLDKLLHTYYCTLRHIEQQNETTYFHTPRMVAFCKQYGQTLSFSDNEQAILIKTAKLHDIGYLSVENKSMAAETEHPLLGKMMIEGYSLPPEVVMGVAAHQEWIDGSGTPSGLKNDEIPWTAKIISIVEFVVQFIEKNKDNNSQSSEEWEESLVEALFSRAGKQFDMLLIPAIVKLIQSLGWNQCCKLGTNNEN